MQQGKQPLWVRLQLFARLTLNAGEDAANQPARLAHLDDGNDRAILVQRHQGPAQIVRLRHRGTPSIDVSDEIAILAARPIASLSLLEGRVTSEPVSEMGFSGAGELQSDSKTFMDDVGSVRAPFRPESAGIWFCPSTGFSGDVVLRY